jgi:2-polyprenyl-3-methyl-5-hydroxy-6-metoxy-1,4-benzoquinol methylase
MFRSFDIRSAQKELMDDPAIGFTAFADCLRDLAIVNILSFGYRPTLNWLKRVFRNTPPGQTISIVDIGSGGGDMLRQIAQSALGHKRKVALTGVDLNPWAAQYAKTVTPPSLLLTFETSDIFDFAVERKFDFAISALFTHHLNDEQLVRFLQWMERHTTRGWFINDLHRHPLAYFLFKYLSRLLRLDYMVQHDGAISVARAFTKADWVRTLSAAGIPMERATIRWYFPFRYAIERRKP